MKRNRPIKALPFGVYFWTVCGLAAVGLGASLYLAVSHYRVYTDMGYSSFCAVSNSINCDTVSQSPYSIFLKVPVPIWGVLGYTFFILWLLLAYSPGAARRRIWPILFFIALCFSLYSLILAAISTFFVRSYCIVCILTYAVNLLLLFYCWLIRKRFSAQKLIPGLGGDIAFVATRTKYLIRNMLPFILVAAGIVLFIPPYWELTPPRLTAVIPRGMTPDGHPWIGAEHPKLEIIEFTDYQCFQCNKVHFYLRHLIEAYPGKIRLIHRHFPMDQKFNPLVKTPLHVRGGGLAMLAIYAAGQGKFWEMNDLLFDIGRQKEGIDLKMVARHTGLKQADLENALRDPGIARKLAIEIREALEIGVSGTPAFLIAGALYLGQIPPRIIKAGLK